MATRLKTIEYVFETDITSRTTATRVDFPTMTAYIPEKTGTVTFRSVAIRIFHADDATSVQSLTNWLIGIKLGATAFSDVTVTDTMTNSGEAQTYILTRDVTSYFNTNWGAGTSQTMQVAISRAGGVTQNHSAKVIITYEYDDAQPTQIKTIRIPLESTRVTLTTGYQTIGGATALPAFVGGYLPEAGVTVRQAWIEFWANNNDNAVVDFTVTARIAGSATKVIWDNESALASAIWCYSIYDVTGQPLSSAVSVEALSSATAKMGQLGGMICCTYEYTESTTTTVHNSILIGAYDSIGTTGGITASEKDIWGRNIYIEEPGTIAMKESGVCLFAMDAAVSNMQVKVGNQNTRAYTTMGAALMCGQYSWVHRIDSSGQTGTAGMTLARGSNDYKIHVFTTTANQGWNLSGFLLLNYTSGKSSSGTGAHAHTVRHSVGNTDVDDPVRYFTASSLNIPETNYYLTGAVVESNIIMTAVTGRFVGINAEKQVGEGEGGGWEVLYGGSALGDAENSLQTIWGAARKAWKRWDGDLDPDRMDIKLSRRWKLDTAPAGWADMASWFTYHTHLFTCSGTITGFTGTVTLTLFRASNNEAVKQTTRSGDGAYSFTWYDNTEAMYVVATDGTNVGRSQNTLAS